MYSKDGITSGEKEGIPSIGSVLDGTVRKREEEAEEEERAKAKAKAKERRNSSSSIASASSSHSENKTDASPSQTAISDEYLKSDVSSVGALLSILQKGHKPPSKVVLEDNSDDAASVITQVSIGPGDESG